MLNSEKSIPNRTPYRLLLRSAYCLNRCFLSCIFDQRGILAVGFQRGRGGLDRLRQLGVAFGDVDPQRQRVDQRVELIAAAAALVDNDLRRRGNLKLGADVLRQQRTGGFRRRRELLNGDGRFAVFQAPLIGVFFRLVTRVVPACRPTFTPHSSSSVFGCTAPPFRAMIDAPERA